MNQAGTLILRWLAWTLLLTFESVVGFPWLSVYLAGEWLLSSSGKIGVPSLLLMALIISAVYGASLTFSMMLMLGLWQALLRTRRSSWARWLVYGVGAVAIGAEAGIGLNFLTVSLTFVSLLLLGRSWQKTKLRRFSKISA